MPVMYHVTSQWNGIEGAPGFTNWYFETTDPLAAGAAAAANKVADAWSAASTSLPLGASITVRPEVETIDDITGDLLDVFPVTIIGGTISGDGASEYAGPAGMLINFRTNGIHSGKPRRVRGKCFFVPCGKDAFLAGGALRAADTARMQALANVLLGAGPRFGIWARHLPARTLPPAHGVIPGAFFPAVSATVSSKAAVLRSRRD
jgi:hypothetical protein